MEGGGWRAEGVGWRVEGGGWRAESGGRSIWDKSARMGKIPNPFQYTGLSRTGLCTVYCTEQ